MLTKQDLIDLLNSIESLPNDAPVLMKTATGIMTVAEITPCIYEPTTRYGTYHEPASIFSYVNGEEVYHPYKLAIQIHLGDKI